MTRTLWLVMLSAFFVSPLIAADELVWEGKWNNKKYGTSGPLRCVAKETSDGTWKGTFSGKFQGEGFSYDATFDAKPGKGQTNLSGTAVVRGHNYTWTGSIKGNQLKGSYKSNIGYYGDFTLTEPKARK